MNPLKSGLQGDGFVKYVYCILEVKISNLWLLQRLYSEIDKGFSPSETAHCNKQELCVC